MDLLEKFFSKIERIPECGCWIWIGKTNGCGYGELRIPPKIDGKYEIVLAHRFSFETFNGPLGGMNSLHRCDVPCCVNPHHLFRGTPHDNVIDMINKGRAKMRWVDGAAYRKLSDEDHAEIISSSENRQVLAKRFGVHPTHINWIKRKKA